MRSCRSVERHGAIEWDESEPRRFDSCRISRHAGRQFYQLFSDSVREEALLGLDGMDDAVRDRCDAVLRDLDLLDSVQRHPMSLSGGQKQRLAIACALMSDKRFIVLDEPTSGLDRLHMTQVGGLLRKLADRGKAVLVVTHDYELAALWCDRIIALEDELHNEQGEEEDRLAWTSM